MATYTATTTATGMVMITTMYGYGYSYAYVRLHTTHFLASHSVTVTIQLVFYLTVILVTRVFLDQQRCICQSAMITKMASASGDRQRSPKWQLVGEVVGDDRRACN